MLPFRRHVPEWARPMTAPRYRRFRELVEQTLRAYGADPQWGDGAIRLPQRDGRPWRLGLRKLVQQCCLLPDDDWPDVIFAHFDSALGETARLEETRHRELWADPEAARGALRVRLFERDAMNGKPTNFVHREDLPGLATALVCDLPHSLRTVSVDDVADWDESTGELLEIGLRNVLQRATVDVDQAGPEDSTPTTFVLSVEDDVYAGSHVLRPDHHFAPAAAPHGVLVAAPHRHMAVLHPIVDLEVIAAIQRLLPFVRRCFDEGPGSISPELYWWRPEAGFTLLPHEAHGETIAFHPPPAFVELLERLRE